MWMFCLHLWLCPRCMSGAGGDQKRTLNSLDLELQPVVSSHVVVVFWKNSRCSQQFLQPPPPFLACRVHAMVHWKGKRTTCRNSLLPQCGFRGLNSGSQILVASTSTYWTLSPVFVSSFNLSCCLLLSQDIWSLCEPWDCVICWKYLFVVVWLCP